MDACASRRRLRPGRVTDLRGSAHHRLQPVLLRSRGLRRIRHGQADARHLRPRRRLRRGPLLATQYGLAVNARDGDTSNATTSSLRGDCFAGAWAASVFLHDRPDSSIKLSPGDLDKALSALLIFRGPGDEARQGAGTTRIEAYRTGLLDRVQPCITLTPQISCTTITSMTIVKDDTHERCRNDGGSHDGHRGGDVQRRLQHPRIRNGLTLLGGLEHLDEREHRDRYDDAGLQRLLIKDSDVSPPGAPAFTTSAPTLNPLGKPGVATAFTSADGADVIGDTILVLPNAQSAATVLQASTQSLSQSVTGGARPRTGGHGTV